MAISVLGIVQARMGSTRLPMKVLKEINGKSLIEILFYRLSQSKKIDKIILATSENIENDLLVNLVEKLGYEVFCGNETDVLDRYYHAAKKHQPEAVVRITGDCPIIDPTLVDKVISIYGEENADYVSNINPPTYPDGLDVEVFSFSALNKAWENAQLPSEREHVTPYFHNKENFKIINVENDKNISNLRLTVDRIEDFELIKQILNNISINPIHLEDVLELFSRKPELIEINKHINHNEGFNKSLEEDKEFIKKQKI